MHCHAGPKDNFFPHEDGHGLDRGASKVVTCCWYGLQETWQAMEKLVDEGLTRSIGISNFSVKKIKVCALPNGFITQVLEFIWYLMIPGRTC